MRDGTLTKYSRIRFKNVVSRLTGFSIPIFGVSWNPPEPERKIIRRLFTFLEDRRVLFNPYSLEVESQVTDSVLEIRKELTNTLNQLPEDSKAAQSVRAIRAVCRKFMDEPYPEMPHIGWPMMPGREASAGFFVALGELRAVFGTHLAILAVQYGINIEEDLASILPATEE